MTMNQARIPDTKSLVARDRVLLYTRGMDIEPEDGVALALESMRRAGRGAGPDKVMAELFGLLRENGGPPAVAGGESLPLVCAPPLNRRTVLPKDMEPLSLTTAIIKWCRTVFTRTAKKDATKDEG
ncbi:hypothetical protein KL86DPRO_10910 [uncultured delta proteobacterium]|uniref:Uncharacterized protein n=1 Tax=uncultured delta proteobacterium TaxID=34034 RepID=A0A212J898_9DELT|nr:hypothetical protein KL86DPRO_10910 [uncultured delta proteobacterium]